MTNSYINRLRTALSLAQPTGKWTNSFGYDAAKRLTNVTSQAGTFSYILGGTSSESPLPKKILLPNTSYITNTYDTAARLTGTWLKKSDDTTLNKHEYTYNVGHQRTQQTFADGSTYGYTYDDIGQLKIADSSVATQDRGYVYDAAWNLNYRTNYLSLHTFKVDGKNQLTNVSYLGTITNDDNGNLISAAAYGTVDYECAYDDENRLINRYDYNDSYQGSGVPTSPDDLRTEFIYDGQGRLRKRVEYTVSGYPMAWVVASETRYIYDGWRVIQERNSSNTPTVSYTRGTDLSGSLEGAGGIGGLLARSHGYASTNGNWYVHNCHHADGGGNVTYLVNSGQTLAASYKYDAYGNLVSSGGWLASANVYRFSSKEFHANSGLYYYGYRWYHPNLQRWLNRDPINELGFELIDHPRSARLSYFGHDSTFIKNEPVGLVDPLGLKIWAGKGCKGEDARKMMSGFLARCEQAKKKACFTKCLGKGAPGMADPCDPNKHSDIVVECEDKSASGCQARKGPGGTPCGWPESGSNPNYPGKKVVHVCMGMDKATGCSDTGCSLLHEVAHAAGGVGPDLKDNRAYELEECVGCK